MRRWLPAIGLASLMLSTACGARITPTDLSVRGASVVLVGSEGSFRLSDNCVGTGTNFDRPNFCTKDPLSDPEIVFDPAGVFEVTRVESDPEYPSQAFVYARALSEGEVTATFSATIDGEGYSKVESVRAVYPTEMTGEFCDGKPLVASSQPVTTGFRAFFEGESLAMRRMTRDDLRAVIQWEPDEAFELDPLIMDNGNWFVALRAGDYRGEGVFTSPYDPDFEVPFEVIDPVSIDEIVVDRMSGPWVADHLNQDARTLSIEVLAGGRELCGERVPIRWVSTTPEVCEPFAPFGQPGVDAVHGDTINLAIYGDGECILNATPEPSAGDADTQTLSVPVMVSR